MCVRGVHGFTCGHQLPTDVDIRRCLPGTTCPASLLRMKITELENKMYALLSSEAEPLRPRYVATKAHSGPTNPAIRKNLHPTNEELRAKKDNMTNGDRLNKILDRTIRVKEALKEKDKVQLELASLFLTFTGEMRSIEKGFTNHVEQRNGEEENLWRGIEEGFSPFAQLVDDDGEIIPDEEYYQQMELLAEGEEEEDDDEDGGVSVLGEGGSGSDTESEGEDEDDDDASLPDEYFIPIDQ
ncbi:MAG: hypothetical protein M1823_006080 [Watsoniomyces obsoletus]|nr:MAG: hypothetical protein M1823_006080 [Watsoniomyces obsoletus]